MSEQRQATIAGIAQRILVVRGRRVMLDSDLAALYGVETKRLNEQVKRNRRRFPSDFMFELNAMEIESLRSQIATLKISRGKHRKYAPKVFDELERKLAGHDSTIADILDAIRRLAIGPLEASRPIGFTADLK